MKVLFTRKAARVPFPPCDSVDHRTLIRVYERQNVGTNNYIILSRYGIVYIAVYGGTTDW